MSCDAIFVCRFGSRALMTVELVVGTFRAMLAYSVPVELKAIRLRLVISQKIAHLRSSKTCNALYDYTAADTDEISFAEGSICFVYRHMRRCTL